MDWVFDFLIRPFLPSMRVVPRAVIFLAECLVINDLLSVGCLRYSAFPAPFVDRG